MYTSHLFTHSRTIEVFDFKSKQKFRTKVDINKKEEDDGQ